MNIEQLLRKFGGEKFCKNKNKYNVGAGNPILLCFGFGCKIIRSSILDPIENPFDEFEQLLQKFDGGMGTLKACEKIIANLKVMLGKMIPFSFLELITWCLHTRCVFYFDYGNDTISSYRM